MENLREAIKERVRFYTELLKVLIVLSATLLGGMVGLLFKLDNSLSIFLLFLGAILEFVIIGFMLRLYLEIEELLRRLEE